MLKSKLNEADTQNKELREKVVALEIKCAALESHEEDLKIVDEKLESEKTEKRKLQKSLSYIKSKQLKKDSYQPCT